MADIFTRDKLAWLDQVAADPEVPHVAFRIAFVLASQFLNRGSGDAWPAQTTLAAATHSSRRAVQRALDDLVRSRHLAVTVQKGRGGANRYRPVVNASPAAHLERADNAPAMAHKAHDKCAAGDAFSDGLMRHSEHVNAPNLTGKCVTGGARIPMKNPIENTTEEICPTDLFGSKDQPRSVAPKKPPEIDARFEEFWRTYPKREGRKSASQQFRKIVESGEATAVEVIAGAARYAAARTDQDPKFTKQPLTWLNGGHWTDEAAPSTSTGGGAGQHSAIVQAVLSAGRRG